MKENPATIRMIDGATGPTISNVFVNNACAACTLQITGTFTAALVRVEGLVNVSSGEWVPLGSFNMTNLDLTGVGATNAGIYQVGIEGILRVRVNVTEVTGGDITVVAQFGNAVIGQFDESKVSYLIPPEGQSVIAGNAPDFTAARAYAVGEFLMAGGKLWRVTADISAGNTVEPGTNAEETTVGEQLTALYRLINA